MQTYPIAGACQPVSNEITIEPADGLQIYQTAEVFTITERSVAIIGDISKFVPLSENRISEVNINPSGLVTVSIKPSPHENLILKLEMVDIDAVF